MNEIDIGGAARECNSLLVRSDLQGAEPVEYGIAVQFGPHQSFLDGDELPEFDEAGRVWALCQIPRHAAG